MPPAAGDPRGGVEVERVFVGTGCNRVVNNVSWGACGLVAFGAQNAVALFSPSRGEIVTTLPGHKASVNCTLWLPTKKDVLQARHRETHYLLSGSSDGAIMAWKIGSGKGEWSHALQLPGMHKKGVTCLAGRMVSNNVSIFASTSSDGTVVIWEMAVEPTAGGSCEVSSLYSLSVGSKPMVSLSLAVLPEQEGRLILAMGGLDHKVHIYCGDQSGKFIKACELKGHSDWIRSLDFSLPVMMGSENHSLFLVSSSQDRTIRIWKMTSDAVSSGSTVQSRKENIGMTSYIEGPLFVAGNTSYQVLLESLLVGHEDWVYSVEWQPPTLLPGDEAHQPMSILSASMDKMMMVWRPEKNTGLWINSVTVGELSHSALGFYGGHWEPGGKSILAHGYGGSFHMWRDVGVDSENWQPRIVPSGHFAPVSDLTWSRSGEYLLSVSHDQTTRIFAPWRSQVNPGDVICWREIARPQIHGHDINCVAFIQGTGNHRFVSGADEKVSRVFEAPLSFLKTLQEATLLKPDNNEYFDNVQVLGANMSALGLSQKPIYTHGAKESTSNISNDGPDSIERIPDAVPTVFTEPPVEDQLAWNTLWPESHKLYGHGNELFSICCDHTGKLVASSCKAQSAPVAEIWLWEVGTWKAVGHLQSHNLTVTQMEFSCDNAFLLSVSRDRHLSVFSIRKTEEGAEHHLVAKQEAHKRIIWACSWNPFGYEFATGSRDKTVKIWCVQDASSVKLLATLPQFHDSVTALAWMGRDRARNAGLLAVGMDNGMIELWSISGGRAAADTSSDPSLLSVACMLRFDPLLCHVSTVHRLRWQKSDSSDEKSALELASCGADHCVRVFEIRDS